MKDQQPNTSFLMLTLEDYERSNAEKKDLSARNTQLQDNLMKFEYFLKGLNDDQDMIDAFNKNLEKFNKIGTALFTTYEEVKEKLTINLSKPST